MKQIIMTVSLLITLAISGLVSDAKMINANVKIKQIPAGTRLKLILIDPIASPSSNEGDIFTAMLDEDQKVDGIILLPKGSMVRGTIGKVVPSKRLSKTAILYLNLDHIVTPVGKQLPISAGLAAPTDLTIDGGIKNGGNYGYAIQQNVKTAGNMIKKSTQWGLESGDIAKYIYTPFAATLSTVGAGIYLVFDSTFDLVRKGNPVVLHQGGSLNIMLLKSIDIPIS